VSVCAVCVYLGCHNINEIQVRCHNSAEGCRWTGIIGTLQEHLKNTCELEEARISQVKKRDPKITGPIPDHLKDVLSLKEGSGFEGENGFIITKFNQMKFNKKSFLSSPFSSTHGYRLVLMVSPYGCGHGLGTHITVSIGILTGAKDGKLHWPFVSNVTVVLMNQLSNENHYFKNLKSCGNGEKDGRPGGRACMDMCYIAHSRLESDSNNNTQYLKDDTVYFKVIVE